MLGNTFITGATGFLGSELVDQILKGKFADRVVCLVRDFVPTSRFFVEELNSRVIVVHGDVRDWRLVSRVMNEYRISTVFHLAAQTLVENALSSPAETLDVNIAGTIAILEAVRENATVKATVVASSDKAYGSLDKEKYDETFPLAGTFPYDVSKSCSDLITQSYAKTYDLNALITRCGNFFGPGDLNDSRLFPSTILSLLKNERPLIRSDGKFVRDYIFISDGASAYLTLARHALKARAPAEAFNFSYGLRLSVLDVVKEIQKQMGTTLEPVIENRAGREIPVQTLDSSKARAVLGWKPEIGFENGLKRTIEWYKQRHSAKLRLAA